MPGEVKSLMKDGQWLVPPEQRPKSWEKLTSAAVKKPAEPATPLLDDAIKSTVEKEANPKKKHAKKYRVDDWPEMRAKIEKSGRWFGADDELLRAALIFIAGLFVGCNRRPVSRLTGYPRPEVGPVVDRLVKYDLWTREGHVHLGQIDGDNGDLEFWLNAMVAQGRFYRTPDGAFGLAEWEGKSGLK